MRDNQSEKVPGGIFIEASALFGIAHRAASRLASNPQAQERDDAIIAIVFSAFSLEALINELGALAAQRTQSILPQPQSIHLFATYWEDAERTRGSTRLKYDLAAIAFRGSAFNKGEQPYQDFSLLIELRDEFAHLRPLERFFHHPGQEPPMTITPAPILSRLRSKNIMRPNEPDAIGSWVTKVATREAAVWACDTGAKMVQYVVGMVPDSGLKQSLEVLYLRNFRPIAAGP